MKDAVQRTKQLGNSRASIALASAPAAPPPPQLQGWLMKQGDKGLIRSFKRRWFVGREGT